MKIKPLWRIKLDILFTGYLLTPKFIRDRVMHHINEKSRMKECGDFTVLRGEILTKD